MKRLTGLIVLSLGLASAPSWAAGSPPLKIGHRGARALVDENTLESLQKAAALGVDMLEFDIQRTRDGVFVIMHDPTVDRTTEGTGAIAEMTAAEFQQLKTPSGYTPPTLNEVLDWLAGNDLKFILDFKVKDPAFVRDLVAIIEQRGMLGRAVFESTLPKVAAEVEKIKPEAVTSIYPAAMPCMIYFMEKYDIDQASYNYNFATPGQVWLNRHLGNEVVVWTVNSRGLIKWFTCLKVQGIMTDDPNLFQPKK